MGLTVERSKRLVECMICEGPITKGTPRVTLIWYNRHEGQLYRKIKYIHADPSEGCMTNYLQWRIDHLPELEQKSNNPAGRPVNMDLTPEQREERTKVMRAISGQINYYITSGKLPDNPERYSRKFNENMQGYVLRLVELGGVPSRYSGYLPASSDIV